MDIFQNHFLSFFHEKIDHFSRNKKDGTIKTRAFCRKEYAESIGTVRWMLAPSNVEIIDSIYIFQIGQFLKSFYSKTAGPIELKIGVQMRETILEKWFLKRGGSIKYSFFQRKMPRSTPHSRENYLK